MKLAFQKLSSIPIVLSVFALLLASERSAHAETDDGPEYDLLLAESPAPLLGSTWAENHPGKLPYSKCGFVQSIRDFQWDPKTLKWGSPHVFSSLGVGIGYTLPKRLDLFACVSKEHSLAFVLPIRLGESFSLGQIGTSFSDGSFSSIAFRSSSLHQKKVRDLTGWYGGAALGVTAFAGGKASAQWNSSGVCLTTKAVTGLFEVQLGPSICSLFNCSYGTWGTAYSLQSLSSSLYLLSRSTVGEKVSTDPGRLVLSKSDRRPAIQLGENTFEDHLTIQDPAYAADPTIVKGTAQFSKRTTLPEGSLAVWDATEKAFVIQYSVQNGPVLEQKRRRAEWARAIDGTSIGEMARGRDDQAVLTLGDKQIFLNKENERVLLKQGHEIDFEALGDLEFEWDGQK